MPKQSDKLDMKSNLTGNQVNIIKKRIFQLDEIIGKSHTECKHRRRRRKEKE